MGTANGLGCYRFSATGRLYGVAARIRGRLHIIGMCQRGIFWRFGARIFSPVDGYWESVFGVRSRIKLIETMLKVGMKNEIIPVRFRPGWVRGSIHFSRTGCISFVVAEVDSKVFPPVNPADYELVPWAEGKDAIARVAGSEEWH